MSEQQQQLESPEHVDVPMPPEISDGSFRAEEDPRPALSDDRVRRIAEAAYYRSQRRGFEAGREEEDWLAAEQELATLQNT